MAKLPKIDFEAMRIRDMLNRGERTEAKARVLSLLAEGKAGSDAQKIAAELFGAKRGKPAYGAKHRWHEIGQDNDLWRDEGVPYAERMARLSLKYRLNDESKIRAAIARYEAGMDVSRHEP
ncbi:hypothetical protein [Sinorhizobium medicae]|uniref:hypothetical protein n=1 Tax=Sinorhizobium medicae TaxID=110321 RepID=UPI000C7A1D9D|nr:hypothetical protein [Sinorhizobium medicae]MDX0426824.1 hypothetical protein [Sinorhizobium medicae]PLU02320.1 hypothetical protein BMJ32_12910 [Sinorhizobium medicae]PLU64539.1 hypothetical protein BMJ21_23010 [Sinorhizobium medicae]TWA22760.1 hypothetical protein FB006_10950 [Sinorhizobium medicae]TWA43058.1 hypothetical protein FB005_10950 [Sinorhizobium medicae]